MWRQGYSNKAAATPVMTARVIKVCSNWAVATPVMTPARVSNLRLNRAVDRPVITPARLIKLYATRLDCSHGKQDECYHGSF